MAKAYYTCPRCGKEITVEGHNRREAEEKAEYYATRGYICKDCYREDVREQEAAEAEKNSMPALTGTEKQIAYANSFRADLIKANSEDDEFLDYLRTITDAKTFIEHHTDLKGWFEAEYALPRAEEQWNDMTEEEKMEFLYAFLFTCKGYESNAALRSRYNALKEGRNTYGYFKAKSEADINNETIVEACAEVKSLIDADLTGEHDDTVMPVVLDGSEKQIALAEKIREKYLANKKQDAYEFACGIKHASFWIENSHPDAMDIDRTVAYHMNKDDIEKAYQKASELFEKTETRGLSEAKVKMSEIHGIVKKVRALETAALREHHVVMVPKKDVVYQSYNYVRIILRTAEMSYTIPKAFIRKITGTEDLAITLPADATITLSWKDGEWKDEIHSTEYLKAFYPEMPAGTRTEAVEWAPVKPRNQGYEVVAHVPDEIEPVVPIIPEELKRGETTD